MARGLLVILVSLLSLPVRLHAGINDNDSLLREIIRSRNQAEVTIPLPGMQELDELTRNVSVISVKDNKVTIVLSPLTVEWFISRNYDYTVKIPSAAKSFAVTPAPRILSDWDAYPTYPQYDSIMQSYAAGYPALCRLDTIGTSVNGKLVLSLMITGDAGSNEAKPEVFYSSTIHGDETGGFVLMLHLIDYLLKNYNTDSYVTSLMDNLKIYINPLSNPDGTYNHGDVINNPTRFNANGYDLNRNFPDPVTPNTVKQKETIDMVSYMRRHRFVLSANFHSGSEVVNYPWDRWLSRLHADNDWFYGISRAYADTAHYYAGPEYMNFLDDGVTRGAEWYIIYGGRQDFITWELQGREVTIELDDQYITPAPQLPLLWQENYHSLLEYLGNAMYGIHGKVINRGTSLPVPAEIFIRGHDKDSSQVYSDTLTGNFVRFLFPGTWDLTFTAKGYRDTTITGVGVWQDQRTDLTVEMSPLPESIDSTEKMALKLYPVPATSEIRTELPETFAGKVNITIYDMSGKLMLDRDTEYYPGSPITTSTDFLPSGSYTMIISGKHIKGTVRGRFVVVK